MSSHIIKSSLICIIMGLHDSFLNHEFIFLEIYESYNNIKIFTYLVQDFTLDMYFRQFWRDERLSFNRPGLEKLVVGAEYINQIWVPDTFFVNEKTAYFHKATTENQFLRIMHTGEILRSIR